MTPRNETRRHNGRRVIQPTAPKGNGLHGPALALVAGAAIAGWSVTRPVGFALGVLIGALLAAWALCELRYRVKARQIANRNRRRGGYVR